MNNLIRYLLIALAIVIPYWIITPSSAGGWVLFFVIAAVASGAVEGAYRRVVS